MAKSALVELCEYDVTQKIIESMSNPCNRAVLFCVRDRAKEASEICSELGISLSAVYKSLAALEDLALLAVGGFRFRDGKKIKRYRSRISRVEITIEDMKPVLSLYPAGPERRGGGGGRGQGAPGGQGGPAGAGVAAAPAA